MRDDSADRSLFHGASAPVELGLRLVLRLGRPVSVVIDDEALPTRSVVGKLFREDVLDRRPTRCRGQPVVGIDKHGVGAREPSESAFMPRPPTDGAI